MSGDFYFHISKNNTNRPLRSVIEAADAKQKRVKKCGSCLINAHFEPVFNIAAATQIVFQCLLSQRTTVRVGFCRVRMQLL